MKKTTNYIIAIVLLLAANLYFLFSGNSKNPVEDRSYFDSEDIQLIKQMTFSVDQGVVNMKKTTNGWMLNDEYQIDQGFFNTLLSVFDRLETKREISNWQGEVLGQVEIIVDGGSKYLFNIASNPNRTKSYFVSDGTAVEVSVPGYRDNVVDIFLLHPDQWRDRLIIDGSWRTIQRATVVYEENEKPNLEITFNDTFFLVNGENPGDSTSVVNYLNQFEFFQANEMISAARIPQMDSLKALPHLATLSLDDIKNTSTITLKIYPRSNEQPYHLAVDQDDNMMVIDARRIVNILRSPADFGVK